MFVGRRIKELRKEKNLTQEQLAELVGTKKAVISRYENDINLPNVVTLNKLADTFKTTTDYILGRDNRVIFDDDTSYSFKIPSLYLRVIKNIIDNEDLINFLIDDPERRVEYISNKIFR